MKKWHVTLPKGEELWLESDTPHEDLEKMGYSEYALTDVRIIPEKELPAEIEWVRPQEVAEAANAYDHRTNERKEDK